MSRKDFELIAKTIKDLPIDDGLKVIVAGHFALALSPTNDRFQAGRFIAAATKEK